MPYLVSIHFIDHLKKVIEMSVDYVKPNNYNENTRAVNKAFVDVSRGSVSKEL